MADYRELGYANDLTYNAQASDIPELSSLGGATASGSAVSITDNGVLGAETDNDPENVDFNEVQTSQLKGQDLMEQLNMGQFAYIKGGVTTYRDGNGFFLGWYKPLTKFVFFVGNSAADNMYYDGTNLYITGSLVAGSIHIPDSDTTANSFHVDTTGNMWIGTTTTLFTANHRNAKAYIENDGDAFFQNVEVNGTIRTAVFEKDVVSAVGGQLIVANADKINTDMTALDSSAMVISGETTLALNSIVHIKDGIDEEYLRVTNVASAPSYTVTRDLAAAYPANTNPAWKKGTALVVEGISDGAAAYSGGYLRLLGSGTNAPRYGVFKRTGIAYNAITEYIGMGNLNGLLDYVADEYGVVTGTVADGYMAFDPTNGLRISAAKVSINQRFTAGWDITAGEVSAIESDGKTYPPRYTANFSQAAAGVSLTTAGTSATRGDACIVGHIETAATFKCTALAVVAYGGNVIYKVSVVTNSPIAFATQAEGTVAAGSDGRVCPVLTTTALASYITGTTATGKVISGLDASPTVNGATTISTSARTPRTVRHSDTIVACAYIDTATGNLNTRILTVGATSFTASAATTIVATIGANVWDFKRFGTTNYYMISFEDTSNNQKVVCVEFDGSTFTAGTPVTHVATSSGRFLEIDGLDSTRMIVLYLDGANCIGTVFSRSTLTLTGGSPVTLKTDAPSPYNSNHLVDVVALGADTFAFFYPTSSANVSNFALGRVTGTVPSNLGSVYAETQSNETVCNVLKFNPIYCGFFTQDSSGSMNTIFRAGAPTNTFSQTIGIVADTTATAAIGGVVMSGYSDDVSGLTTATPYYLDVDGGLITRMQGGLQRVGIALSATTMKVE